MKTPEITTTEPASFAACGGSAASLHAGETFRLASPTGPLCRVTGRSKRGNVKYVFEGQNLEFAMKPQHRIWRQNTLISENDQMPANPK